jgi:hypothetical protein
MDWKRTSLRRKIGYKQKLWYLWAKNHPHYQHAIEVRVGLYVPDKKLNKRSLWGFSVKMTEGFEEWSGLAVGLSIKPPKKGIHECCTSKWSIDYRMEWKGAKV